MSSFSIAQQSDASIYRVDKSRDFTAYFSLKWEYPSALEEMLPTRNKDSVINWQSILIKIKENKARYKSLALPQKESLASCALMLILLDREADSEFYQQKAIYVQLLLDRLKPSEKEYFKTCLHYLEQENSPQQIIRLWQIYFHYTSNGHQALYVAEKLLAATQKAPKLPSERQEDLMATVYYLTGAIYADRGEHTKRARYYRLCYELRKKRGDDLLYSMSRLLNNTSQGIEQRKVLFKDLLSSIQEHGCRSNKKLFQESIAYLLERREYDLALELFEQGTLQFPGLQDIEDLSYGTHCPYFYLGIEALSQGSTFDDVGQDSIAIHWFGKWLAVLDSLSPEKTANTPDQLHLEQQYYLNYTDHTCTRIIA